MNTIHITRIDEAINNVERWFSNTLLLGKGNNMFRFEETLEKDKTQFALWYYGEGQVFNSFGSYKNIEKYYDDLFTTHVAFYELYHEPVKRSLFSSNKGKREQELHELLEALRQKTTSLVHQLHRFKTQLIASPLYTSTGTNRVPDKTTPEPSPKKQPQSENTKNNSIDLDDEIRRILS